MADWVIVPSAPAAWIAPVSYISLVALALVLTLLHGWVRLVVLVPVLYLAAFVWENVMLAKPEPTRYIILGVILDRADDLAPVGAARREARGDHLDGATEKLLDLQGVSMAFGGLKVVDDLDLHVDEGEIVSVIGPNGAGQDDAVQPRSRASTSRPTATSSSRARASRASSRTRSRGVGSRARSRRCACSSTCRVRENVMAAAYGHTKAGVFRSMLRTPGMRREEQEIRELAEKRLAFFGERLMGYRWDQPAYSLSYANRRRLEIARATATNPRMLLLDEPAAGMNPKETQEITELIGQAADRGGLHDPRDRARHARGRGDLRSRRSRSTTALKIAEGTFEEVATSPQVVEAYLGTGGMAKK